MFHNDRRRGYGDNTISTKLPSFHGGCSYKEFQKCKDKMDAIFDGDYYSEREKVKLPLVLSMTILLNGGMRRNIVGIFMVTDHSIRGMS